MLVFYNFKEKEIHFLSFVKYDQFLIQYNEKTVFLFVVQNRRFVVSIICPFPKISKLFLLL